MAYWHIEQAELVKWLELFDLGQPKFHGILSDPPYALISIAKRFGPGQAPAQEGADGRYERVSRGFMGQTWDGWESLKDYQDWIAQWAELLITFALNPGAVCLFFGGTRTFYHLALGLERGGFEIVDTLMWLHGQGFPKRKTMLKPAWEPIILCRAPKGKYEQFNFQQLMEEFGTGSLNIDGSRIEAEPYQVNTFDEGAKPWGDAAGEAYTGREETRGRWPANVILDEEAAEMLDAQAGHLKSGHTKTLRRKSTRNWSGEWKGGDAERATYGDAGGPSRFFYCSKASRAEKDLGLEHFWWERGDEGWKRVSLSEYEQLDKNRRAHGCIHPTVKPLDLLRYLANLIKPPDTVKSRLLVPFSGSGSEMIGAIQAGWSEVVGVEREAIYNEMAEARLAAHLGML